MRRRKVLVCGASGFIGRNLLERLAARPDLEVTALLHRGSLPRRAFPRVRWRREDLRLAAGADRAARGMDVVLQAAATTSGSRDIVSRPHHHVTDNAVMNSHLLRACHERGVGLFVFFSCSVMYPPGPVPVREGDFSHEITPAYFGVGWTKVYVERMAEFYSRLGRTRALVVRHSNIYGPHDKYDLEKSHVFGATVAKVLAAPEGGRVEVWGGGREERDLLYVSDLVDFVEAALAREPERFDLVNVGSGAAVSVRELVARVIAASGRRLGVRYDRSKPSIPFRLALDCARARKRYGWAPKVGLDEGIRRSLEFCRSRRPRSAR